MSTPRPAPVATAAPPAANRPALPYLPTSTATHYSGWTRGLLDAADVQQETALKLLEREATGAPPPLNPPAYAACIARNMVRGVLRTRGLRVRAEDEAYWRRQAISGTSTSTTETPLLISQLLTQLPPAEATALSRWLDGSYSNLGSERLARHRAIRRCRELLGIKLPGFAPSAPGTARLLTHPGSSLSEGAA